MVERGRKLAEGRAAEIFEYGAGRVIRVARAAADYRREAAAMQLAGDAGLPVPRVFEVTETTMVLERIEGPTMLADLAVRPWRLRDRARMLAALHDAVHGVEVQAGALPEAPVPGSSLLHLDLHPDNVMLASSGPVLIDWSNAALGDASADLSMTWILMSTSQIEAPTARRLALEAFRNSFVSLWLRRVDRDAARRALRTVAELRVHDPNVTSIEAERVRMLVARHGM